jgi:predicted ester cyclase
MTSSTPADVVRALFAPAEDGGIGLGDLSYVDELLAIDFVNHAAAPQGRAGWKAIVTVIEADLGPVTVEHHHVLADGEFVAHHMTLHGTHRGSTMPLLAGREPTGRPIAWRYLHLWRVVDGLVVEHWAYRDDLGLLAQLEATNGPSTTP